MKRLAALALAASVLVVAPSSVAAAIPAGWPDATNTGVPAGTTLTTISGSFTIDAAYAATLPGAGTPASPYIFEKKLVTGMLVVDVPYVLVRKVRVLGNGYYGIWSPADHVTVIDSELGPDTGAVDYALSFEDYGTARRVDVHNGRVGIKVRSNGRILDSYIHDIWQQSGDHNGGINSPQGNNGVIRHNTIVGLTIPNGGRNHNGISIYTDLGPSSNWVIRDNYIDHSGHHVYGNVGPPYTIRGNVLTDDVQWQVFYNAQGGWTASGNVDQDGNPVALT